MAGLSGADPAAVAVHWLDLDAADAAADGAVLDAAEAARAARLREPLARARFVAARAGLRRLLARRLRYGPAAVPLAAGPHGKPVLAGSPLAFSLARRGRVAVAALGGTRALGIDVEQLGEDAAAGLAALLTPAELAAAAGDAHRRWVRREAVGKADGRGLGCPVAAASLAGELASVAGAPYRLCDLAAPTGHVAALAVAGAGPVLVAVSPPAWPAAPG